MIQNDLIEAIGRAQTRGGAMLQGGTFGEKKE